MQILPISNRDSRKSKKNPLEIFILNFKIAKTHAEIEVSAKNRQNEKISIETSTVYRQGRLSKQISLLETSQQGKNIKFSYLHYQDN